MSFDQIKVDPESEKLIKKLTADLEAANKELDSLSYAVSHDLRAPLRAIEGFADVLLEDYRGKLDEEGQRFLEIIKSSGLKATRMVEGLLAYSRMGRHEMTLSGVDVQELVRNTLTDLKQNIGERKIDFVIGPLPRLEADLFLVREIWKHLLGNAIKFTAKNPSPRIEVSSCEEKNQYVFSIHDNGVGFDMKYSEKLFQLFQRLHGESDFEGLGVGLSIAQRLVLRQGGKIWATSEPNCGATFNFTLPRHN
jgi:light-regulated signal transduction histidine kinase (bacteriophytochrome)